MSEHEHHCGWMVSPGKAPEFVGGFVKLGDGNNAVYIDPRRVEVVKPSGTDRANAWVYTSGHHATYITGWSAGRVASEVVRALMPGVDVPSAGMRGGGEEGTTFDPREAPEAPAPGIPLAVGQVWATDDGGPTYTAKIDQIDGGHGLVYFTFRGPAGRDYEGVYHEADFRRLYRRLVSPAPEASETPPEPSPPPPDPVPLLAAGKRLRFVRDAGPIGDGLTMVATADVSASSCRDKYRGYINPSDMTTAICTVEYSDRKPAANDLLRILACLGYRFDGPAE